MTGERENSDTAGKNKVKCHQDWESSIQNCRHSERFSVT